MLKLIGYGMMVVAAVTGFFLVTGNPNPVSVMPTGICLAVAFLLGACISTFKESNRLPTLY